ncbi:MAG TPA: thiol:disulfide interchange protein DsbA/DsbL [Halothiobacillus sp.]|nr:thiol:disulfide interchange protein DsbA/DsbL [Halothiobacillus sp.]
MSTRNIPRSMIRNRLAQFGLLICTLMSFSVGHAATGAAPTASDTAPAVQLEENKNYRVVITDVAPPTDGKILVQELFWYGCPHCFHLEPKVEAWRKTLPSDVEFEPYALPLSPGWLPLTKAFFAAKFMGVLPQTHRAVFDDIHIKHIHPVTKEQIADMYADLGVNRDKFLQMYDSFGVDNAVRQAQMVGQDAGVTGVPALLVNGKYLVTGDMVGSNEAMLPVVSALIAKITAEKRKQAS